MGNNTSRRNSSNKQHLHWFKPVPALSMVTSGGTRLWILEIESMIAFRGVVPADNLFLLFQHLNWLSLPLPIIREWERCGLNSPIILFLPLARIKTYLRDTPPATVSLVVAFPAITASGKYLNRTSKLSFPLPLTSEPM